LKKVIVAQKLKQEILDMLSQVGVVEIVKEGDVEDLKAKLPGAECIILGTWVKLNAEMLALADGLKVISRTGVGVDNVDVEEATKKGIMVLNTPTANAISVAEHTISFICALSKYIVYLDTAIRNNNFKARRQYLPVDLDGKVLGLIGFGTIGKQVAHKCNAAFNMKALAYDPWVKTAPDYTTLVDSMDEVFKNADFISIHLPLLPTTRNLVNAEKLSMIKPSAFLINTSRGGIVDEVALADALKNGTIAGAALDVFESEPPSSESPLLKLPNIIMTPHSAALTQECTVRVAMCAAQGVIDYLNGTTPEFIYNRKQLNIG
jgi:D-3-phosphoglycerate dehydrogenase